MRHFTTVLTAMCVVLFIAWRPAARGMDAILATVLSIDVEQGEMYVDTNNSEKVRVTFIRDQVNSNIQPGSKIRIWGDYKSNQLTRDAVKTFNAGYIRDVRLNHDPTGVRSRLRKGMGRSRGRAGSHNRGTGTGSHGHNK